MNETVLIICVVIILVWYYFYIYKQGKSLSDLLNKPASSPAPAPAQASSTPEEFANDVRKYKQDMFSDDSLQKHL